MSTVHKSTASTVVFDGHQYRRDYFKVLQITQMGRDSSVGVATCYGLDGRGIKSWWGRDFPHLSRPALGPIRLLYNGYRVFPGSKVAGTWHWPPTPSSAEVKERVQLYLYSSSEPSWPVLGWTLLPLPLREWPEDDHFAVKTCSLVTQLINFNIRYPQCALILKIK